jgi:hypothetical protein
MPTLNRADKLFSNVGNVADARRTVRNQRGLLAFLSGGKLSEELKDEYIVRGQELKALKSGPGAKVRHVPHVDDLEGFEKAYRSIPSRLFRAGTNENWSRSSRNKISRIFPVGHLDIDTTAQEIIEVDTTTNGVRVVPSNQSISDGRKRRRDSLHPSVTKDRVAKATFGDEWDSLVAKPQPYIYNTSDHTNMKTKPLLPASNAESYTSVEEMIRADANHYANQMMLQPHNPAYQVQNQVRGKDLDSLSLGASGAAAAVAGEAIHSVPGGMGGPYLPPPSGGEGEGEGEGEGVVVVPGGDDGGDIIHYRTPIVPGHWFSDRGFAPQAKKHKGVLENVWEDTKSLGLGLHQGAENTVRLMTAPITYPVNKIQAGYLGPYAKYAQANIDATDEALKQTELGLSHLKDNVLHFHDRLGESLSDIFQGKTTEGINEAVDMTFDTVIPIAIIAYGTKGVSGQLGGGAAAEAAEEGAAAAAEAGEIELALDPIDPANPEQILEDLDDISMEDLLEQDDEDEFFFDEEEGGVMQDIELNEVKQDASGAPRPPPSWGASPWGTGLRRRTSAAAAVRDHTNVYLHEEGLHHLPRRLAPQQKRMVEHHRKRFHALASRNPQQAAGKLLRFVRKFQKDIRAVKGPTINRNSAAVAVDMATKQSGLETPLSQISKGSAAATPTRVVEAMMRAATSTPRATTQYLSWMNRVRGLTPTQKSQLVHRMHTLIETRPDLFNVHGGASEYASRHPGAWLRQAISVFN